MCGFVRRAIGDVMAKKRKKVKSRDILVRRKQADMNKELDELIRMCQTIGVWVTGMRSRLERLRAAELPRPDVDPLPWE